MPGRVHVHDGIEVYHRADGALAFHGRKHARLMRGWDRRIHARRHPEKKGYPHAGDGRPKHEGKNEPIHRRKGKKGRRKGRR